jgi:soluble epoxide hydrolase / lipid-phosphate phosphatase
LLDMTGSWPLMRRIYAITVNISCLIKCRGAGIVSRVANYHADRFIGFGFITVGYIAAQTSPQPEQMEALVKLLGYSPLGYFEFFGTEDSAKTIEEHVRSCAHYLSIANYLSCIHIQIDSFMSLTWPKDNKLHIKELCPEGALKSWLESDKKAPMLTSSIATPDVSRISYNSLSAFNS